MLEAFMPFAVYFIKIKYYTWWSKKVSHQVFVISSLGTNSFQGSFTGTLDSQRVGNRVKWLVVIINMLFHWNKQKMQHMGREY